MDRGRVPAPPPAAILTRYRARTLDPTGAELLADQETYPTAYVADRLLLRRSCRTETRQLLDPLAGRVGLRVREGRTSRCLHLVPDGQPAVSDAWRVLQALRGDQGGAAARRLGVGLDHLMFATTAGPTIRPLPYYESHPYRPLPYYESHPYGPHPYYESHASPTAQYGRLGFGATQPVNLVLERPRRTALGFRRPVVAVLDTGCGPHPWLDEAVRRDVTLDGVRVSDPGSALDTDGDLAGPVDGMRDVLAGHGTFICGLVRQSCPDADIIPVPVIHADGVVIESELLTALHRLAELARRHAAGTGGHPIDVVSLSLGYYHESPADAAHDSALHEALDELGELGVAVVASAGNDATAQPMFPAAFAPNKAGPVFEPLPSSVPLTSVGALNPNGTIALFSNTGTWVRHWEPGAAVVSTMPLFDHAGLPVARVPDPYHPDLMRETIDPDSFASGFAVGSGTSFAAPVLAGRIAQKLIDNARAEGGIALDAVGDQAVERGSRALTALLTS
ncbi:S8 family serine peptidase [Actinomycetes bacterium KLBMP 9797]